MPKFEKTPRKFQENTQTEGQTKGWREGQTDTFL